MWFCILEMVVFITIVFLMKNFDQAIFEHAVTSTKFKSFQIVCQYQSPVPFFRIRRVCIAIPGLKFTWGK